MIAGEDDAPGADNRVTVLSYALWQRQFGADSGIVGRTLRINAENYRVLGVMPRGFDYPERSELWCPLVPHGQFRDNRRAHLLTVIADLRAEQTLGNAQGEIVALGERIEKQNRTDDPDMALAAVSLKKSMVAPVQPALMVLVFAVGLLLVMACANLANLLLARAAGREKEYSLRAALGAGRGRLARQLLTECLMLALPGAALGLGIAAWSLQFIVALDSRDLPRFGDIRVDWRVLGFALLVSCFSALLFGLAPALSSTKTDLNASLKAGATASPGGTRRGSSRALVVPQFALAVVLLVGAGLLGNSFVRLLRVNPGFSQDSVLTIGLFLSPTEYPERDVKSAVLLQQILASLRSIAGVRSAGLVTALPITGGASTDFVIEGRPVPPANDEPSADIRSVDPSYFQTMGIPLLSGREFTDADNANGKRVMVINETMARQYWPRENPLGQAVTMKDWGPPLTGEIVGVVGDVKTNGLDEAVGPMIYWPYFQFPQLFNTLVVRSEGDLFRLVPAVKAAIWAVNKNQAISKIETLEQVLSESLARRRLYMILLGVFCGCGAASCGRWNLWRGVLLREPTDAGDGYSNSGWCGAGRRIAAGPRARGTRGAAGNRRWDRGGAGPDAADGEFALRRKRSRSVDVPAVATLLTLVALSASYIPASRAMCVDPMVALRHE